MKKSLVKMLGSGSLLALTAALTAAGVGACSDPQEPSVTPVGCASDGACPALNYCSASGQCKQDCDPRSLQDSCGQGLSCSPRGRCVDSSLQCAQSSECDSPPGGSPTCDGQTSVIPRSVGRCVDPGQGKRCQYDDERVPCPEGCDRATGLCASQVDPCQGKVCNSPPAPSCKGDSRVTYAMMGACMGQGQCVYQETEEVCANGCAAGACSAGGCQAVTCDRPPAPRCAQDDPSLAIQSSPMGTCEEREGAASCRYETTLTRCTYTGATCQAGACTSPKAQSGQVIVTEIMSDPASPLSPFNHEWFEITNVSNGDLDLRGWTIKSRGPSGADELHVIAPKDAQGQDAPLIMRAGERLILANGSDPLGDGSLTPGYVYQDVILFFEDTIELLDAQGQTVDFVYWEGGSTMPGRTRKLDPQGPQDAQANDDVTRWCPELGVTYGQGGANFGSPGAANGPCVADPCAGYDCGGKPAGSCTSGGDAITYMRDAATCQRSRFNNPFCDFGLTQVMCDKATTLCQAGICQPFPQNLPAPGEVIITETLGNPKGTDSEGEWVELYNTTDRELALFGLKLVDNEEGSAYSESEILEPQAVIPAKGYAVLITNTDPATNGGIPNGYRLSTSLLKNTPTLDANGRSTMRLKLIKRDGAVIDEAYYMEASNNNAGASSQLSLSAYKDAPGAASANDDHTRFCPGTFVYDAAKGLGTPGADNAECP